MRYFPEVNQIRRFRGFPRLVYFGVSGGFVGGAGTGVATASGASILASGAGLAGTAGFAAGEGFVAAAGLAGFGGGYVVQK